MKNLLKKQITEDINTNLYVNTIKINTTEVVFEASEDEDAVNNSKRIQESIECVIMSSETLMRAFTKIKLLYIRVYAYDVYATIYFRGKKRPITIEYSDTDADVAAECFGEDWIEIYNLIMGSEYFYPEVNYCYYDNNSFNNMVLSHGLDTGYCDHVDDYNYKTPAEKLYDIVSHPEWEICCSHGSQKIGAVGVILTATNLTVCNRDMRSRLICIEDNSICTSRRYANGIYTKDREGNSLIVRSISDYSLDRWDHTEHIVCMPLIKSIWIKEWALNDPDFDWRYKPLLDYAEEHGLKVEVVKARREH